MKKVMKLSIFVFLMSMSVLVFGSIDASAEETEVNVKWPVYRVYNPDSGEHLFTMDAAEHQTLVEIGWKNEGTAFYGLGRLTDLNQQVVRLYNPNSGEHLYTANSYEVLHLMSIGWSNDCTGFITAEPDGQPVYRLYNPNAKKAGGHHFTLDEGEKDYLVKVGWKYEGIAFYGYADFSTRDFPID